MCKCITYRRVCQPLASRMIHYAYRLTHFYTYRWQLSFNGLASKTCSPWKLWGNSFSALIGWWTDAKSYCLIWKSWLSWYVMYYDVMILSLWILTHQMIRWIHVQFSNNRLKTFKQKIIKRGKKGNRQLGGKSTEKFLQIFLLYFKLCFRPFRTFMGLVKA